MGYFNYFIKCIIRNFSYKLCKPKVFLTVLLSFAILFGLKHFGYCAEWTDGEIEAVLDGLATITSNQGTVISQLSSMGIDVDIIQNDLDSVKLSLNSINNNTSNINLNLIDLVNKVEAINTTLLQLAHQQNIQYNNIYNELNDIKNVLLGNGIETSISYNIVTKLRPNNYSSSSYFVTSSVSSTSYFEYNPKCSYKIDVTNNGSSVYGFGVYYGDNVPAVNVGYTLLIYKSVNADTSSTYTVPSGLNCKYIYLAYNTSVSYTITQEEGTVGLDSINNSMQQNNQLQQEQNNFLQQESSDSDVSVDSFNSVDANDVTSDGLTGVFTNIYNSITSWTSKDINLPIPYTNKSIIIPANYTHNMLSSFGGSWIISFISTIYYFIVARFIIYSITSIINSIKSGSILETDSKNNITTDML